MRTKKITRKLSLNKETISNLKDEEMTRLNGGATVALTVCRTVCITNCRPCTVISWCYQCMTDEASACYAC
jgi:natural product precursor